MSLIRTSLERREFLPIKNWPEYLEEAREEFEKRHALNFVPVYNRKHFEFIRTIGEGTYSRVILVKMISNQGHYALKIMDKIRIVKEKQTKHVKSEKKILQALNFPFCIHLETAFMDNSYVYLCLPFIQGGEMFNLLQKMGKFHEYLTKFYGAQILLAFEYIHYCHLVFRDLKPENILINQNGYLKLADFGFCKLVKTRTYTLCGTPDYIAPEILMQRGYAHSVDWWSYGVLLYEMASGSAPFYAKDPLKLYENVLNGRYKMPSFFSKDLANLIENLLQVDISMRLGCMKDGVSEVKGHSWFSKIDFVSIFNGTVDAPFLPAIKKDGDYENFDFFREGRLEVSNTEFYAEEFKDF